MAVRKRFSAAERELLASGQAIDVQNVTQWHAATLVPGAEVTRDSHGWESIAARIDATRGTVHAGDAWSITPGHVRPRSEAGPVPLPVTPAEARDAYAITGQRVTCVNTWHGQRYPADAISHARAAASWLTGWPASDK